MTETDPVPADDEVFEPGPDDLDPEAAEQMQQGRVDLDPNNALYDPWFESPEAAARWDGVSEYAEGGA